MDLRDPALPAVNPSTKHKTLPRLLPWKVPAVRALQVALDTHAAFGSGDDAATQQTQ